MRVSRARERHVKPFTINHHQSTSIQITSQQYHTSSWCYVMVYTIERGCKVSEGCVILCIMIQVATTEGIEGGWNM